MPIIISLYDCKQLVLSQYDERFQLLGDAKAISRRFLCPGRFHSSTVYVDSVPGYIKRELA